MDLGARVAAMCGNGGFAEEVCAPANSCVRVPDNMAFTDAAGLQVAYGTADLALRIRARLRRGETLLVLGAAGGVGLAAVEIGNLLGARVIACARGSTRLARARQKGADLGIDTELEDIRDSVKSATGGAGVDVVFDPVGGSQFRDALRAVAFGARVLPIGFASGETPQVPANIVLIKNIDIVGVYWGAYYQRRPEILANSFRRILSWYAERAISPGTSRTLPLEDAETALDLLRNRNASGKIVLTVA